MRSATRLGYCFERAQKRWVVLWLCEPTYGQYKLCILFNREFPSYSTPIVKPKLELFGVNTIVNSQGARWRDRLLLNELVDRFLADISGHVGQGIGQSVTNHAMPTTLVVAVRCTNKSRDFRAQPDAPSEEIGMDHMTMHYIGFESRNQLSNLPKRSHCIQQMFGHANRDDVDVFGGWSNLCRTCQVDQLNLMAKPGISVCEIDRLPLSTTESESCYQ